jgi:ureidoglycolate hydrolase
MLKIKNLTETNFKKYGIIIKPKDKNRIFDVLCKEDEPVGWRIGYLVFKPEPVKTLEAHPESMETFEPVKGVSIIILAENKRPEKIEAFLLEKPVCLKKGIWHAILAISENIEIKITENLKVESIYHKLKKPLNLEIL